MRLRPKILLSVLVPLLLGILIILGVTSGLFGLLNNFTSGVTSGQILNNVHDLLNVTAQSKGQLINEFIGELLTSTSSMAYFVNQYLNGNFTSASLQSYSGLSAINNGVYPPGGLSLDYYGRESSAAASAWYLPGYTSSASITPQVQYELNLSSIIDISFIAVTKANVQYVYSQMGFLDTGLFRIYPFVDLDSDLTQTIVCIPTNMNQTGYDPRCRPWFVSARENPGITSLTAPYLTSIQGLGLVVASARDLTVNGTFVGAISLNLVINQLEQAIITSTILQTGYAFVIDTQGNLIFHPSLNHLVPTNLQQAEFHGIQTDFNNFGTILAQMQAGKSGNDTYYKEGNLWYISYVYVPNANYSLAAVVPNTDIQAPVQAFQNSLLQLLGIQLGIFIGVMIVVTIVFYVALTLFIRRLVRPIQELTNLCDQIGRGDLEKDLSEVNTFSKEISEVYKTFGALLLTLRFGNEEYYNGDKKKAMKNYQHALEMFQSLNNEKATGVCHNNIGNVYRSEGNFEEAEKHYKFAIEYGVRLNDPPTIESQKTLASRYNNLAMLYVYFGGTADHNQQAERMIFQALEVDSKTLDAVDMINHNATLALLYLKTERIHEAGDILSRIEEIPHQSFADKKAAEQVVKVKEHVEQVRINPTILHGKTIKLKDIFFLLDYSGSMAGGKNKASLAGIKSIFTDQVSNGDNVCVITFNTQSVEVVKLQPKGGNETQILNQIEFLTYPTGGTAFFDALGDAFSYVSKAPPDRDQWIIALTDGDDNNSKRFSPGSVRSLASQYPKTSIVIISVGQLESKDVLSSIVKATSSGVLLDVNDSGNAITQAFQEVATLLEAQVETYDFKYDL